MARMHSRKRGQAKSRKPAGRPKPEGMKLKEKDIEKKVMELAADGKSPSQIGNTLRDEFGVADVKAATGKKIGQIMADNDAQPELPEDLLELIKKAVMIRRHLESNHKDEPAKRGLILTESKILRLTKYYKGTGRVASTWNYNPKEASYLAE